MILALSAVAALCGACGSAGGANAPTNFTVDRMRSSSGQDEIVLRPHSAITGLVLFMHGFDAHETEILDDPALFPVRDALIGAGYVIAASDAHGNNAGNPQSIRDQADVAADARALVGASLPVDVLAFSMGGADALLTAARHAVIGLRAVALLSPVTDTLAFLDTPYRSAIATAFGDQGSDALNRAVSADDPILLPPGDFTGVSYRFWRSPGDQVVPPSQSDRMAARLTAAGVDAAVSPLTGEHGDLSALSPSSVVAFFRNGVAS